MMKTSNKLVSIILPTFNGNKYLKQSIQSCLEQTYKNIELIIIIDGSTDDTRSTIDSFNDPRLRVIDNSKNLGFPAGLNIGLRASKGSYLTWTSDDNYYHSNAIFSLVETLEHAQKSGCELVYADSYAINEAGEAIDSIFCEQAFECVTDMNNVGACFLFSRKLYEEIGEYNESIQGVEDYDFWLRARLKFDFFALNEKLYTYRFHQGSLTTKYADQIREMTEGVLKRHHCLWQFNSRKKHDRSDTKLKSFGVELDEISDQMQQALYLELVNGDYAAIATTPAIPVIDSKEKSFRVFSIFDVTADMLDVSSLVTTNVVADLIGSSYSMTAEQVIRQVFRNGGKIAYAFGLHNADTEQKNKSFQSWFALGLRMNDIDKYKFSVLLKQMLRPKVMTKSPHEFSYFSGMLAAKLHNFPKHILKSKLLEIVDRIKK